MLSTFSQYSPQGLISPIPGLPGAGLPQINPGLFAQPGAYANSAPYAYDSRYAGAMTPYSFVGQPGLGQHTPFGPGSFGQTQTPFLQAPLVTSPFIQPGLQPNSHAINPYLSSLAAHLGTSQLGAVGQVVQQILAQGILAHGIAAQQTGIALQQLALQGLQLNGQHTQPFGGLEAGQMLGGPQSFLGAPFGQPFAGSPFGSGVPGPYGQGAYGAFGPQAPAWAAGRPTIQ